MSNYPIPCCVECGKRVEYDTTWSMYVCKEHGMYIRIEFRKEETEK